LKEGGRLEKPIEYEQTDIRWKNIMYSSIGNRSQTIGTSGCGPTCAAMVISTLRDDNIQPPSACSWAVANGFRTANDGTAWGFFVPYFKRYNIKCRQSAKSSDALAALKKGYMVIAAAGKGIWTSGGHFILAWGLDAAGNRVYVHDPNSEAPLRELANVTNFKNECTQFWIIEESWGDDVEIKVLEIKNMDTSKMVEVEAVNVEGNNYIKLRDVEKLFPVTVDWNGKNPTIQQNFKK
jgi:hypothetical protein